MACTHLPVGVQTCISRIFEEIINFLNTHDVHDGKFQVERERMKCGKIYLDSFQLCQFKEESQEEFTPP